MDGVSREIISVPLVRSSEKNMSEGLYIMASAPRSMAWHDWCISERTTLYQKVDTPKEPIYESQTATPEDKCNSSERSIFQTPVSQNMKRTFEITEYVEDHVQLISSDEGEQIEVNDPPQPTITIESFDEDELEISSKDQPGVRRKVNGLVSSVVRHVDIKRTIQIIEYNELDSSDEEDDIEVVLTTQPKIIDHVQILSSDEDEDIDVGLELQPNITFESFNVDEKSIVDLTANDSDISQFISNKYPAILEGDLDFHPPPKIIDHVEILSSDDDEDIDVVGLELQPNITIERFYVDKTMVDLCDNGSDITENVITGNVVDYEDRNIPRSDISQFISTKYPAILESDLDFHPQPKIIDHVQVLSSDDDEDIDVVGLELQSNITIECFDDDETSTVDLPDNDSDITENVVQHEDRNIPGTDISQFISTKYPAILESDLDFHHLKGTENIRERRTFCRESVRAKMEKFYNESWGGENFDHEQILKHMPRDKHLWAIDERDRLRDESTVICDHCDLPGHRDDTCPTKTPVCYMCGLTDHIEPSCPRKNCLICGSHNQLYSSMYCDCCGCGALACSECSQHGHPSSHCPDLWRRYHSTINNNAPLERCDQSKEQDQYCTIYPPTTTTSNTNQEQPYKNTPQEHSPAWTPRNYPYKRQLSSSPTHESQVKKKKIMPSHEDERLLFYTYF